ncbi:transglycosylase [Paenibacillus larvae]
MKVTCKEGRNKEFTISRLKAKRLRDGIEKNYFTCPHCSKEYVSYYTDAAIRKEQKRLLDIEKKHKQTRKIELKEEYKRKYKKLFADIVKASDDLKTRIESHANR